MITIKHPYNPKTGEKITEVYTVREPTEEERKVLEALLSEGHGGGE